MVFLLWFEIEPVPGCKVVPESFDPRMECAVEAPDAEAAREKLELRLARDRYRVRVLEACVRFDADAWTDVNDPDGAVRAAAARARTALSYASFGCGPEAALPTDQRSVDPSEAHRS